MEAIYLIKLNCLVKQENENYEVKLCRDLTHAGHT